jgi:hypothetical protein
MPDFYFPTEKTYDFLKSLAQGFCLEISERGEIVLMIKMEPSLLMAIIKGCKISLRISNPNINYRGCVLIVYDKIDDPFYFSAENFGTESLSLKGFDEVMTTLAIKHNHLKVALYNELNHPIYTTNLPVSYNSAAFDQWLNNIYNTPEYRDFAQQTYQVPQVTDNEKHGYTIEIENTNHSNEKKLIILSPEYGETWREDQTSKNGSFNVDDYMSNGKHGCLQEFSITSNLSRFFQPGIDFFSSPKYANGLEYTDYVIIDKNAAIFIESKYVISEKQTKKHQALHKAVLQLNKAEDVILYSKLSLLEDCMQRSLENVSMVLKVCLINDQVELNGNNTKVITDKFDKSELPIFISLTAFINLLVGLSLKNEPYLRINLFSNLITMFNEYFKSDDKLLYKNSFSVEGLTAAELNVLGKKRS